MTGRSIILFAVLTQITILSSCASPEQTAILATATTGVGTVVPGTSIEQTYYLGTFDPREHIPPTIYRVKVRGQASFISDTKFASGWVDARLIDSLSGEVSLNATNAGAGSIKLSGAAGDYILQGDRMVQFGPEGFRTVPNKYRLVLVMGSDPSAFFQAMDKALGHVSQLKANVQKDQQAMDILKARLKAKSHKEKLRGLKDEIRGD